MVRYIKLGDGGRWEEECINRDSTLRLGYESPHHQDCLEGNWDIVREYWLGERNGNQASATNDIREIRAFYEAPKDDIWITFYRGRLWWCNADAAVIKLDDGTRTRRAIDGWSCETQDGELLEIANLDGRVTKVQGYRRTICEIDQSDYLLRKIRGEAQPDVSAAKATLNQLKQDVENLIRGLWWKDFELLVDLIFSKMGWQRLSQLGKTQKGIDLDVFSPIIHNRAFVQIKSHTTPNEVREYFAEFEHRPEFQEMYFVVHSYAGCRSDLGIKDERFRFWDSARIAELVINAGLIDWLIAKRS